MPLDLATYRKQFLVNYGERFKTLSPALVDLYLLVAEHDGLRISELRDLAKVGRFTLNTMLRFLGPSYVLETESGKRTKIGHGLIRLQVSLKNRREREVVLSTKGKQIFKELKAQLEPPE